MRITPTLAQVLARMEPHQAAQKLAIVDGDYDALKRRKLLRSLYSLPRDGIAERVRLFSLTAAGIESVQHARSGAAQSR